MEPGVLGASKENGTEDRQSFHRPQDKTYALAPVYSRIAFRAGVVAGGRKKKGLGVEGVESNNGAVQGGARSSERQRKQI